MDLKSKNFICFNGPFSEFTHIASCATFYKWKRSKYSKDLSKYYDAASKEERKYMIKTIIREITIKLKKKEEKGTIEIHFRGDGHIKKEWVNRIVNPDKIVSSYYLDWLRKLKLLRTFFSNNKELFTYQYCVKMLAGK